MTPGDRPPTWDERATLLTMLRYTRDCALQHLDDLAPELVGAAPLPTSDRGPTKSPTRSSATGR